MNLADVPKLLLIGFVLLAPLTVLFGFRALQYAGDQAAYDVSRSCESTADVTQCRYEGRARVISTGEDKYSHLWVAVAFDELGGLKADGVVGDQLRSAWRQWVPGAVIDAELWRGSITKIAEVDTDDNPQNLESSYKPPALIFTGLTALLLVMFVLVKIVVWRGAAH